jgi:hypothetical protein
MCLAFVVIGLLPGALTEWGWYRYYRPPLHELIALHRGDVRVRDFTTWTSGDYWLFITLEAQTDRKRMSCLFGASDSQKCNGVPAIFDVSWGIWHKGELVTTGTSGAWQMEGRLAAALIPGISRAIGRFRAQKGEQYVLLMNFKGDPSELNVAKPTVVAKAAKFLVGGFEYLEVFSLLWAISVAALAFALLRRVPGEVATLR